MLKALKLGRTYHVKSYRTLCKECRKFRGYSPDYNIKKRFQYIANREFIPLIVIDKHHTRLKYTEHAIGYKNSFFTYIVYPHEVIEFDEPNINIPIF